MIPEEVVHRAQTRATVEADGHRISWYSVGSHGYPQIGWTKNGHTTMMLVHRVVWEAANGPIPEDMTVDHICKEKRCSALSHLRLITRAHNSAVGRGPDRPAGVCKRGHDPKRYSRGNNGHLVCLDCKLERRRERV